MNIHALIFAFTCILFAVSYAGVQSESVQNVCYPNGTCTNVLFLTISLTPSENLNYNKHGISIQLNRIQEYAAFELEHRGHIYNTYEHYVHDDSCGVNKNVGECLEESPSTTLCCISPFANPLFQRLTGQHCLRRDTEYPIQSYNIVGYSLWYQVLGQLVKDDHNYDLYWNRSENQTISIEHVISSIMKVTTGSHEIQLAQMPFRYVMLLNHTSEPEGHEKDGDFEWFFISRYDSAYEKIFITDSNWMWKSKCNEPMNTHTATQEEDARDQYYYIRHQTLSTLVDLAVPSTTTFTYPPHSSHMFATFDYNTPDVYIIEMQVINV